MNSGRPNEPPMPDPLGFFLTWPTCGTWLPGDDRGWIEYRHGWQVADEKRRTLSKALMSETACILAPRQRQLVEDTVRKHCEIRRWELFAVNCRSNHIHVVVAADQNPKKITSELKSWCTRRLKEQQTETEVPAEHVRTQWWAERGSRRYLNTQQSLESAIQFTLEAQDNVHPRNT